MKLDWESIPNLDMEAWNMWVKYRRNKGRPPYTTLRQAKKLAHRPLPKQMGDVEHSIEHEWMGVFNKPEPKPEVYAASFKPAPQQNWEVSSEEVARAYLTKMRNRK